MEGIVELSTKVQGYPQITIVGLKSLKIPTQINQIAFKLLPEKTTLDVPEIDKSIISQIYWWQHVEARIDSEPSMNGISWFSRSSLIEVSDTWANNDDLLLKNSLTLDDTLYTKALKEMDSSYILTRDDLKMLLMMKGSMCLRESISCQFSSDPQDAFRRIMGAYERNLLTRSNYMVGADYLELIKATGLRINTFYQNLKSWFGFDSFPSFDYFSKEIELLSMKYPDADCIQVGPDGIDLTEILTSLSFSKDNELTNKIAISILKPLELIFSSLVIGAAFTHTIESVSRVLTITDKSIINRYARMDKKDLPYFLRGCDNDA